VGRNQRLYGLRRFYIPLQIKSKRVIEFLSLPESERRDLISQTSFQTGITEKAIEKDWWVTLVLKALYSLPMAEHFIFKGGTSLSKGWKIIKRFSEDVDIALEPKAFGMEYRRDPSRMYVKKLKREGCRFTNEVIKSALEEKMTEMGVSGDLITIEAEAVNPIVPDKDPQTLFVKYRSLYETNAYIADEVKVEFSVRSLKEPLATVSIQSILAENLDDLDYDEPSFNVVAVEPRKTFLEKAFLLYEKFLENEDEERLADRQSRHLSDLVKMMNTEHEDAVWADTAFYDRLIEHRSRYIGHRNVDYQKMNMPDLRFVPSPSMMDYFRKDYETMLNEMIYDDSAPDFDTLIEQLAVLNGRFVLHGDKDLLDQIIEHGKELIEIIVDSPLEGDIKAGLNTYHIVFLRRKNKLVFHRIEEIMGSDKDAHTLK
jgi:predicted nucleotidyltransferase component of viral defense system